MTLLITLEEKHELQAKMTFCNIIHHHSKKKTLKISEYNTEKFMYIKPKLGHINLLITKQFLLLQFINTKVQHISHIGCIS